MNKFDEAVINDADYNDYYMNHNKKWINFKNELLYSNRFFTKSEISSEILNEIKNYAQRNAVTIDPGKILFRSREYEVNKAICAQDDFNSMTEEQKQEIFVNMIISHAGTKTFNIIAKHPLIAKSLQEKSKSMEWGYSKKESGKPSSEKAGLNRASPRYISYLYLANDVNTALAETRAQIGQAFSIAKYLITKPLTITNLSFSKFRRTHNYHKNTVDVKDFILISNLHQAFSAPSISNEKDYILSQYIAEFIKNIGLDGIAYDSSRYNGGTNYALFNDSSCKFICSEIHAVKDIKIVSKRLLPLDSGSQ